MEEEKVPPEAAATLPKKPPKRTGKSGIRAVDPVGDFDKPITRQGEGSLLAKQPETPTVLNGRILMWYDRPSFSKFKDATLIALQMSTPLGKEHLKCLPKMIVDAYVDINKKGRSRINIKDLPNQAVEFFLDSDTKRATVKISAAKIVNANLALIERKGEGSSRKIIRLQFRLQSENHEALETFACSNLNNHFWIVMQATQKTAWDEGEEED